MSVTTQIPVLIVGGGIVGLSTSLFLSEHGIKSLLVERHAGTSIHPRARGVNRRTMELYRGLGIDEAVRAAGASLSPSKGIYQGHSLFEVIDGQPRNENSGPQRMPGAALLDSFGPVDGTRGTQDMIEPVLLAAARDRGGDLRFHTECLAFEQDKDGVTTTLRDRSRNAELDVFAQYMIAADGAGSLIRRKLGVPTAGAGVLGHLLNILFETDLGEFVQGREFSMCLVDRPEVTGLFTSINNHERWVFHLSYDPKKGENIEDFPPQRCQELVQIALGMPDIEVQVKSILPWEPTVRVAEQFQHGRVFLAGDAAHQMPPWGGQGANTGIADVHNLAWKLAVVLKGQATASLLTTYDAERHPIGQLVSEESGAAADEHGLFSMQKSVLFILALARRIPRMVGYGYIYSSPALSTEDTTPLFWRMLRLVPTPTQILGLCGKAGTRVPHIWVELEGRRISTLDLSDKNFVLITGAGGKVWLEAASKVESSLGVALVVYRAGPGCELVAPKGQWESWAGISTTGATLIRPDGFVAWRSWSNPPDPRQKLEKVWIPAQFAGFTSKRFEISLASVELQVSKKSEQPPSRIFPNVQVASTEFSGRVNGSEAVDPTASPSSLWTAPSPRTKDRSSPVLPSLPPFPSVSGGQQHLPSSPPSHPWTDSSLYYTASWGSPYQNPPSSARTSRADVRRVTLSSDELDDEPIHNLPLRSLNQTFISSPASNSAVRNASRGPRIVTPDTLGPFGFFSPSDPFNRRASTSATDPLRQYLESGQRSERQNWLSDDSADSAVVDVGSTSQPRFNRDSGDPWFEFGGEGELSEEPRTPTLKRFLDKRDKHRTDTLQVRSSGTRRHKYTVSTETLKPTDFWDSSRALRPDQHQESGKMFASKYADPPPSQAPPEKLSVQTANSSSAMAVKSPSPVTEKPLPLTPAVDESPSEIGLPKNVQSASEHFKAGAKSTASPANSGQIVKKRVVWRGKNCVIAIPSEDDRGREGGRPMPLSQEEVEAVFAKWKELGYDVESFNPDQDGNENADKGGQSRQIYPDPSELVLEWKAGKFRVSIPDRREWEAYVNYLKEEKLRALGVSIGDEDLGSALSPAPSSMGRQASAQYPALPYSPPPPTSSATSHHTTQYPNPFSPPFPAGASTNPTSQPSLASPVPSQVNMHLGFQAPFGSPFQFPQAQLTPPTQGMWSPQSFVGSLGAGRGASPVNMSNMPNLGAMVSSTAPTNQYSNPSNEDSQNDLLAQMRQQQDSIQEQLIQQQAQQQAQAAQLLHSQEAVPRQDFDVAESSQEEIQQPEIATPIPRGHRHNLSENLQREIDRVEFNLEESIERQLEETLPQGSPPPLDGPTSLTGDGRLSPYDFGDPKKPQKNQHFLGPLHDELSDGGRTNPSEIDTNPSMPGTPAPDFLHWPEFKNQNSSSGPQLPLKSEGHAPKASLSKLNVAAKEFRFDPSSSFQPGGFSFTGANFQPPQQTQSTVANQNRPSHSHSMVNSFNVAAPEFQPATSTSSLPTGDFSFSAGGPSFSQKQAPSSKSATNFSRPVDNIPGKQKIFGNVDFTTMDIVKPAKKSKAIPIIRPDERPVNSASEKDDISLDDEGRRNAQPEPEGRQKRVRHVDDDGDQIPQFAVPTHPLTETGQSQSPEQVLKQVEYSGPGNKENALPQEEESRDVVPDQPLHIDPPMAKARRSILEESPDYDGKGWEPFEFRMKEEAERFNAAEPFSLPQLKDQEGSEGLSKSQGTNVREKEPTGQETFRKHENKSSLSATAKPFEFNPTAAAPTTAPPAEPFAGKMDSIKLGGMQDSKYAEPLPPSPPSEPKDLAVSVPQSPESVSGFLENDGVEYGPIDGKDSNIVSPIASNISEEISEQSPEPINRPWKAIPQLQPENIRSDAPSPSPKRFIARYHNLPDQPTSSVTPPEHVREWDVERTGLAYDSPVHRLNSPGDAPPSDWDDMLSPTEEAKLQPRSQFFDGHVNNLVGGLLDERLGPLEQALGSIQNSILTLSNRSLSGRGRTSRSVLDSDADDEDDDTEVYKRRSISPRRDRRVEQIKRVVQDALAMQTNIQQSQAQPEYVEYLQQSLEEMKLLFQHHVNNSVEVNRQENIKDIIEQAVNRRMDLVNESVHANRSQFELEELQSRVITLERKLEDAEIRVVEEISSRRETEERAIELEGRLRIAEQEEVRHRQAADESVRMLRAADAERHQTLVQTQMRTALLEGAVENTRRSEKDLIAKNTALESTLQEYRLSGEQWKAERDEAEKESAILRRKMDGLRLQMEESIRVREGLRGKFDKLQGDMAAAARDIANEQATWRRKDEEHKARHELLGARLEAEARTRERLEREIERLEVQERDAMRLRVVNEQLQTSNNRLEEVLNIVRLESIEYQKTAARFEREFNEAREAGRNEVQRTRILMEADIEAANNQVNIVRDDLESKVTRIQHELETTKMDTEAAKARTELLLEEAYDGKRNALREAADGKESAMQEQHRKYEQHLEDLRLRHEKLLQDLAEDHRREETSLLGRLNLSDAKVEHYKDRVAHLEDRLEIAKSAAQAAAQAAQAAKAIPDTSSPVLIQPAPRSTELPEKISPQALRESIMVLQEQLQERELRIENLEQEMSAIDREAPMKVKERDTEIGWLRELLGVRINELEDIINILSQPAYDREAVKDAVIRLRANLQMEQQERERSMAGGQRFPSLSTISSLASPKMVLPLQAAWGNWRKARETSMGNLTEIASGFSQTPSKSNSSPSNQSFLSGLLTPPSTNLRQTPQGSAQASGSKPGMPSTGLSRSASRQSDSTERAVPGPSTPRRTGRENKRLEEPATPPLLRKADYDQDAETNSNFSTSGFYDDDESTVEGNTGDLDRNISPESPPQMPFGPGLRV